MAIASTSRLTLIKEELALLGVLMLRGPQTEAELKSRTERLADWEAARHDATRSSTGWRPSPSRSPATSAAGPGQSQDRWIHLLGAVDLSAAPPLATARGRATESDQRVSELEARVEKLEAEIAELQAATRRVASGYDRQQTDADGPTSFLRSDSSVRVPVREVDLTDGTTFAIYDTSGPGSEPTVGLPALRAPWIEARGDTEVITGRVVQHARRRTWHETRYAVGRCRRRSIRRADARQERLADALRPPRRRSRRRWSSSRLREGVDRRVRPRRSRTRPRHHPEQHQPPRVRADGHRAELPREDQRQHRQLARWRRRSKKKSTS